MARAKKSSKKSDSDVAAVKSKSAAPKSTKKNIKMGDKKKHKKRNPVNLRIYIFKVLKQVRNQK
jgi:hypothetical protein